MLWSWWHCWYATLHHPLLQHHTLPFWRQFLFAEMFLVQLVQKVWQIQPCLVPDVDGCALLFYLCSIWPGGLLWSLGRLEEVGSSRPWGISAQVLVETCIPAEAVRQPWFCCDGLEVCGVPELCVAAASIKVRIKCALDLPWLLDELGATREKLQWRCRVFRAEHGLRSLTCDYDLSSSTVALD